MESEIYLGFLMCVYNINCDDAYNKDSIGGTFNGNSNKILTGLVGFAIFSMTHCSCNVILVNFEWLIISFFPITVFYVNLGTGLYIRLIRI